MAGTDSVDVAGRDIRFTHPDKVMYPATGTTKQNIADYALSVAAWLTAHAHDRPATRKRWVDGVGGESGGEGTPQESLRVVFDSAVDWARGNPRGCAFVNAWAEVGDTSPVAAGIIAEEKLWMRRLFTALAGDEEVGTEIHGIYEGAVVCSTILREPEALERAYATAVTVLEKA